MGEQLNDHVPEQLAARGVRKRAMIRKLVNFANIVQKGPGEQQVAVDLGIIAADDITGAEERDNVVEESADVSMMQTLGSRGIAVGLGDFGIGHE